ncbi:hypothetical protein GW933_00245 [Candidatus Falkowbacteria bacterium]|uniref:Uncharacterized protein n=1 Tax=Candidatus Buchananbacteria bacterium CG10_big_fil_rev_8_21_14_0_10_33_19 TaxID=1974525 RepID=A0A2H0W2X4_9BACT|nr:hypothetical protein [Candidatus Falkowbacteria bacterium]PIS05688.1 MAG: hypothetical protein COT80_02870 [Candidatus Buchananbacteria bacterium CG10_big_fil_rev_8_21_14_0_10_33_19]
MSILNTNRALFDGKLKDNSVVVTYHEVKCEFCGSKYNPGINEDSEKTGAPILVTDFANKQVCACCFPAIEESVKRLMPDVINWYANYLQRSKLELYDAIASLKPLIAIKNSLS